MSFSLRSLVVADCQRERIARRVGPEMFALLVHRNSRDPLTDTGWFVPVTAHSF